MAYIDDNLHYLMDCARDLIGADVTISDCDIIENDCKNNLLKSILILKKSWVQSLDLYFSYKDKIKNGSLKEMPEEEMYFVVDKINDSLGDILHRFSQEKNKGQ